MFLLCTCLFVNLPFKGTLYKMQQNFTTFFVHKHFFIAAFLDAWKRKNLCQRDNFIQIWYFIFILEKARHSEHIGYKKVSYCQ